MTHKYKPRQYLQYEPLPLHLCEMLEREFKEVHKQASGTKIDEQASSKKWLLEEDQIKDASGLINRWNEEMKHRLKDKYRPIASNSKKDLCK